MRKFALSFLFSVILAVLAGRNHGLAAICGGETAGAGRKSYVTCLPYCTGPGDSCAYVNCVTHAGCSMCSNGCVPTGECNIQNCCDGVY